LVSVCRSVLLRRLRRGPRAVDLQVCAVVSGRHRGKMLSEILRPRTDRLLTSLFSRRADVPMFAASPHVATLCKREYGDSALNSQSPKAAGSDGSELSALSP
jgi:hypothetical protein